MEFSSFTFVMTEDCNFKCSYCYQKKEKNYIDIFTIKNAVDFFMPYFTEECYINFYGGEPLLAFDQIKEAVKYIRDKRKGQKRKFKYSITTNGSLINDEIIKFLNQNRFSILLSFDGLAQDISRKKGSLRQIVLNTEKLLKAPDVTMEIHSVFTPETVGYLAKSIQYIIELEVPNISISFSKIFQWRHSSIARLKKELAFLKKIMLSFYKKSKGIPLVDFRKDDWRGIFACFAGKDRMALMPDGKLWGCDLFADYFKGKKRTRDFHKYCFGDLNSFIENYGKIYPKILSNYSDLRMDHFFTSDTLCNQCDKMLGCDVCPMDNVYSSSDIRKVPYWTCEIKKILREEKKLFWKELESQK